MAKIVLLPGDGIGPEIVEAAFVVLSAVSEKFALGLDFEEFLIGGAAYEATGHALPEATLAAAQGAQAVLLGAVGGPKWEQAPLKERPEQALLGLRKALGLYANLRPIKVSPAAAPFSPLREERIRDVDFLLVRELIGGIYFGEHKEAYLNNNGIETAADTEVYTRPEIERIAHFAFQAARQRRGKVTLVDKANVLASSRLWRKITGELALQYPEVQTEYLYVDNCAMQMVLNPGQFDVILTNNIFGDILSDEGSVITGSIGLLPSASIGEGTGLYEPIHGSAPDIAGQGIANPVGTILSGALLLRYSLEKEAAAQAVEKAVETVLAHGYRTADLDGTGLQRVSTAEFGRLVAAAL